MSQLAHAASAANSANAANPLSHASAGSSADAMAALDAAQAAYTQATSVAAQSPAGVMAGASPGSVWGPDMIRFLASSILLFTLAALLLSSFLLWRDKAQANQVLRVFGVISIIGVSALLLIVGFSNDQLTPIVGLFGAIAGYLLGKDAPKE
jgi:hypothetical protein